LLSPLLNDRVVIHVAVLAADVVHPRLLLTHGSPLDDWDTAALIARSLLAASLQCGNNHRIAEIDTNDSANTRVTVRHGSA